ncbi:MAG TPA: MobA/MobL family protein [Azospirillum sp.]|nr:MobA/MobL family protein [Azospirillum sp.]
MTFDNQYHCCIKAVSRSAGRSVIAAAAYRSGTRLCDARTGLTHDYRRKRGIVLSEIVVPPLCEWALDRKKLWDAVAAKVRANGREATECECALPHMLTNEQRSALVRGFAASLVAEGGVAVDYAVHEPHPQRRPRDGAAGADLPGDDARNWHAHILVSHLPITPDGPGKPVSKIFDGPERIEAIRARWAEHVNAAYAAAGIDARQDHRSYAAQGIARRPTHHIGQTIIALERRGRPTERGEIYRARQEARRAGIAVAALAGEQQRRAERRQRPPPPEESPPAPPPASAPQQQEAPMARKYTPRGRVTRMLGGRRLPHPPRQDEPRHSHEQSDDLRTWLWGRAYGDALMPRDWLKSTTAMWTFGEPEGINVQLAADTGRLNDNGRSITWSHADTPSSEQRQAAVSAILDLVEARAWTAITLTGDEAFRTAAAREATRRGITVADEDLQRVVEDERRRLTEQQAAAAPGRGAAPGVAQAAPPAPATVAAVSSAQPSSTIAAFLAAGQVARACGKDADTWLALYAARLSAEQRDEIADHLAQQPAALARWSAANDDALTADALAAAQGRGDARALRDALSVTPPDRRRIVSDILHERADAAVTGVPNDFADLRRRSAAQALAQTWDRGCNEAERTERKAARVEESPPQPPTVRYIRVLGEALLSARRAERDGTGDPYDVLRADNALRRALDRTPPETRRALADALTNRRGGADPLTSALAVGAMAADDRAAGLAGLGDDQRAALRPPRPGATDPEEEPENAAKIEP